MTLESRCTQAHNTCTHASTHTLFKLFKFPMCHTFKALTLQDSWLPSCLFPELFSVGPTSTGRHTVCQVSPHAFPGPHLETSSVGELDRELAPRNPGFLSVGYCCSVRWLCVHSVRSFGGDDLCPGLRGTVVAQQSRSCLLMHTAKNTYCGPGFLVIPTPAPLSSSALALSLRWQVLEG